jgi:VanZ family protein
MRKLCVVYWLLLTVVLLVRNPLSWLRGHRGAVSAYEFLEPWLHFLSFLGLAVVVYSANWRISRYWLALLLPLYAVGTEIVQSFVGRHAEWRDLLQDFLGLAVGGAIAWGLRRFVIRKDADGPNWEAPRRRTTSP